MSDENKSKQVLMNALADLKAFEEKYSTYKELYEVINAIHDFESVMKGA
jgi:hypothetical protein